MGHTGESIPPSPACGGGGLGGWGLIRLRHCVPAPLTLRRTKCPNTQMRGVTPHNHHSAGAPWMVVGDYASFPRASYPVRGRFNPAKGWCFARPSTALGRAKAPLCSALAGTKVDVSITPYNIGGQIRGKRYSNPVSGVGVFPFTYPSPPPPRAPHLVSRTLSPDEYTNPLIGVGIPLPRHASYHVMAGYAYVNPLAGLGYHIPVTHPTMLWQVMLTSTP